MVFMKSATLYYDCLYAVNIFMLYLETGVFLKDSFMLGRAL